MGGQITKHAVDSMKVPPSGEAVLWDDAMAGFGVRVRPNGAKTYIVMYRAGVGRGAPVRKMTIGRHGSPWTPATARVEAKRILGLVAGGADPAAVKAEHRKASTMSDLAERFMEEHVDARRKERTCAEYRRLIDRVLIPEIGKKKIVDVTRADVARLHHDGRGTPYQTNRALAVLSKMFNLAEAWGLRPDGSNPCRHIERFAEAGRERLLSVEELGRIGEALRAYKGSIYVPVAVRLLLFTGARLSEILNLRWSQVDVERGEARLSDSKTGAKTIHLPPPALAVLAALPRVEGNPFVIVGQKDAAAPEKSASGGTPKKEIGHLINLQKPWCAIRKTAKLPDVRLHDLRHAFASAGAAGGDSLIVIGKLLGHTQARTTQRYAHLVPDPARAAAGRIGLHLAAALGDTGNATSDIGLMADETGDTPPADDVTTGAGRTK
jgi:integrase